MDDDDGAGYRDRGPRHSTELSAPVALSQFIGKIPERFRHACTPDQLLRRVFGIEPGWRCTQCARPYDLADFIRAVPPSACPGCLKPLPRRCVNKGCGNLCEPLPGPRGKEWYAANSVCAPCQLGPTRAALAKMLADRIPAAALDGATAWQVDRPWREEVDAIVADWRHQRGAISMLYLHGTPGTGKTVAAAYAIRSVLLALGSTHGGFAWVTEGDILEAHRALYFDGDDAWKKARAEEAVSLLTAVKTRPIVAIDELWKGGSRGYTDKQIERMFDILSWRADNGLLTVFVSNLAYQPSETMWRLAMNMGADGHRGTAMESRFQKCGRVIEATGEDRRRLHLATARIQA